MPEIGHMKNAKKKKNNKKQLKSVEMLVPNYKI